MVLDFSMSHLLTNPNGKSNYILSPIPPDSNIIVSVAMITYNHESCISQAIESVLMQEADFNFELVIGEDCSTDRTCVIIEDYCKQYPEKIRLIRYDRNQGLLLNFYNVLNMCQGKYIALLEGDDYWSSQYKIQKQVDFLEEFRNCSICYHTVECFFEDKSKPSYYYPDFNQKKCSNIEDLLVGNFISTCSVMFKNRLFNKLPDWYFSLKLGDWPLHIFNAQYGEIGYINEVMSAYRIHQGGVWSRKDRYEIILDTEDMLKKVDLFLNKKYTKLIYAAIANWYYELFVEGDKRVNFEEAVNYSKNCIKSRTFLKYKGKKDLLKMYCLAFFPTLYKFLFL